MRGGVSSVRGGVSSESEDWKQTYPMREDTNLYKLPVMTEAHSALHFNQEIQLSSMEEVNQPSCPLSLNVPPTYLFLKCQLGGWRCFYYFFMLFK